MNPSLPFRSSSPRSRTTGRGLGYAASAVLLCIAFGAAAADSAHRHSPATSAGSVTSLDLYARGDTLDVLTGESDTKSQVALWHRQSRDGGRTWSAPSRVDAGMPPPRRPHRGNDAQIASDGRHLVAAWTTAGTGWLGTGRLITAFSADAGKSWTRGGSPAADEREDGQSYADLAARDGRFYLAWLDSRGGSQGVRHAISGDGATSWKANASLQPGSCDCCWNTVLPAPAGALYVLFRGKSPRDMGLAVSRDDGASWRTAGAVGAFDWRIEACPHTGGALALSGKSGSERLHALVWTGKPGARGLHVFNTSDPAAGWTAAARVGGEYAQRGDLAARGSELIAVWDEPVGPHGSVFMSRSRNEGAQWSQPVRLSSDGVNAVYPRIAATRENLLVLWTEAAADAPSKLRMVMLK
ncbi:MAG: repeat domain protein [Betaproteobacteria bacterium]|nr:repeat domain protein [Betaproteobacteria bacterium]